MNLRQRLSKLPEEVFGIDNKLYFREVNSDDDLAVAVCQLTLPPEQQAFVNPAGFSIGRAYLFPDDNVPYLIYAKEQDKEVPVGFISLRFSHSTVDQRSWHYNSNSAPNTNWSYFIDYNYQGKGYGTLSAKLAIKILLKVAPEYPIKLSTESTNIQAQKLYQKLGFIKTDELDGDDLVFIYKT